MILHINRAIVKHKKYKIIYNSKLELPQERRLAKEHGYDDPVNVNYDATTASYYKVADYIMGQVVIRPNNQVQATFATHNEDTVSYVTQR